MVPAFNNRLNGGLFQTKPMAYRVNSTPVYQDYYTGFVRRAGQRNPIVMLGGVIPWRHPSTYDRLATIWSYAGASMRQGSNSITGVYLSRDSVHSGGFTYNGVTFYNTGRCSINSNSQARANTECMLKLNEQKVNVGNMLGEAKSSINMLATTSSTMFDLLLAFKRGDWRKIRKYLGSRSIANGYLQWNYGWKPLASDIKGLFDASQEKLEPPLIFTARRSISSKGSFVAATGGSPALENKYNMINTCCIYARMSDSQIASAQKYGLVNPLSLAWELIPYSFVVDWVMPVGNVLGALTASAGFTFVGGYTSQRTESRATGYAPLASGYSGTPSKVTRESFDFQRFQLTGFPQPSPYVKSPFSTSHTMSALALLRQLR